MIKYVSGGSEWLDVHSYPGSTPYINTSQPSTGMLRMHPSFSNGRLEVYDGSQWQEIGNGHAEIDLNHQAKEVMSWARDKMHAEKRLANLIEQHPGLKELHDKFEMMRVLCEQEEKNEMV
jgi:hypothetical protein